MYEMYTSPCALSVVSVICSVTREKNARRAQTLEADPESRVPPAPPRKGGSEAHVVHQFSRRCEGSRVSGRQASLNHDAGIGDIVEASLLEEDEVLRTLRTRLQPDVH